MSHNEKLISVEEHEALMRMEKERFDVERRKTGVACPKCGNELHWERVVPSGYAKMLGWEFWKSYSNCSNSECKQTVEMMRTDQKER